MAGPNLSLKEELGPAIKVAWVATVSLPLEPFGSRELACGWAGHFPLWAEFQGPDWAGHGLFERPPLPATERVGPGIGV